MGAALFKPSLLGWAVADAVYAAAGIILLGNSPRHDVWNTMPVPQVAAVVLFAMQAAAWGLTKLCAVIRKKLKIADSTEPPVRSALLIAGMMLGNYVISFLLLPASGLTGAHDTFAFYDVFFVITVAGMIFVTDRMKYWLFGLAFLLIPILIYDGGLYELGSPLLDFDGTAGTRRDYAQDSTFLLVPFLTAELFLTSCAVKIVRLLRRRIKRRRECRNETT
ncbi:MAG: hypothetical protein QM689_07000 [Oscillospiraceae bacterium]